EACGAPPPLAGDDLEAIAEAAHHNRLDDAVDPDRFGQLAEPRFVDMRAGLELVWRQPIDVDVDRGRAGRLGEVRDQGAQSFSEGLTFFHTNLYDSILLIYAAGAAARCRISCVSVV